MDWPEHVEASTIRALWVGAQWRFSPFSGWPPSGTVGAVVEFSGREAKFDEIMVALSVVSSRSPLWEAQAQIVDYCSLTAGEPSLQWPELAGLYPEREAWRRLGGIPGFLADAQVAVPYHALISAGRVMSGIFASTTLDVLGYLVAGLPDIEECLVMCNGDPVCMRNCLSGRLGQGG
jgi:hypothetical protein